MLVVPVYNMILVPEATLYLQMEQLKRSSGGKGVSVNERVILVVAKENDNFNEMTEDSFYPIGLAGVIREITQDGHAAIRTQYRVNIESAAVNPDHTIELTLSRRRDIEDLPEAEERGKVKDLQEEMRRFADTTNFGEAAEYFIDQVDSVEAACKSLKSHDKESIDRLVDNIIDDKIKQNQLQNCDLTFGEVTKVRNFLKEKMISIYHSRISYKLKIEN